jgi:CsoR family transcriptional regulator, copper-sensing transcriptional repressor
MRGYTLDKDDYLLRLRKIEGQVRGLQRLVEDDTYCIDILTQIASVNAALQKVALGLVDQHLRHCVMDAMDTDPEVAQQRLTDATLAVQRLLRL